MRSFFNINTMFRKIKSRNEILNLYYPKNVYDPQARKEMKGIITHFNNVFYDAYPEELSGKRDALHRNVPHKHTKNNEVKKALTFYKTKKVRKKDLVKIEEYLQMKYVVKEQITYYEQMLNKSIMMKKHLSDERFSSFFPQLYDNRMLFLKDIEESCLNKIEQLKNEYDVYERTIYELVHYPDNFLKDATRLIGGVVADSMKHVADAVNKSLRRKG